MQLAMKVEVNEQSLTEIGIFIPIVPDNLSTVYTALCFAKNRDEMHRLKVCPMTFNQPLYIKAVEIEAASSNLVNMFVRLGKFHLLCKL